MSYDDTYDEQDGPGESRNMKLLREKAEKADRLEMELAAAQRQIAVRDAGLTGLSPAQMKALEKVHEGDLTAEALQATAAELGFVQPSTEPPAGQAADQRMDAATQGATQPENKSGLEAFLAESQNLSESEFWAKAQQYGVAVDNSVPPPGP